MAAFFETVGMWASMLAASAWTYEWRLRRSRRARRNPLRAELTAVGAGIVAALPWALLTV